MDAVLNTAYTCVGVDSGRIRTGLTPLVFDELGVETAAFAKLILLLIGLSGEGEASYVVLRPDPVHYYSKVLGRYPSFTLAAEDTPEIYLEALGEKLNANEIDNVGSFWSECVISSPSGAWFAHAVRTSGDSGGHLWIPEGWAQQASGCYRWLVPFRSYAPVG